MKRFLIFRRRSSAPVARERLQILLAHERAVGGGQRDLVGILLDEIIAVISKHAPVQRDKVQVKLERGTTMSTLEIGIEMPTLEKTSLAVAA